MDELNEKVKFRKNLLEALADIANSQRRIAKREDGEFEYSK